MDCVVAKLICDLFMQRSVYRSNTNPTFQPRWKEEKKTKSDTVPSPEVINCYLSTINGEISILTACSKICMSCYRFFNETTKQLAQAKSGDQICHETQRC